MARRERKQRRNGAATTPSLVNAALTRWGVARDVREHRIVTAWRELVGDLNASKAWPEALKDGVLHVRVVNSSWLHQLSLARHAVVARITALLGDPPLVKDVRFHIGGRAGAVDPDDVVAALARRQRRTPAGRPPAALTPEAQRRIDAETARVTDPELRELLRALRRRVGG